MKKLLALLLLVLFSFSLAACGNGENNEKTADDILIKDLQTNEIITNCYSSDFVSESSFKYVSHEIIKRQTNLDDKEDIINVSVTAESEYFRAIVDLTVTYNFYDEGGWIADDFFVNNKDITPIKAADKSIISQKYNSFKHAIRISYFEDDIKNIGDKFNENIGIQLWKPCMRNFSFGNCELVNGETRLYAEAKMTFCTVKGYLPLQFDKTNGWHFVEQSYNLGEEPILVITDVEYGDYSAALGKQSIDSDTYIYPTECVIEEINAQAKQIKITWKGKTHIQTFDPINVKFSAPWTEENSYNRGDYNPTIVYNMENNSWQNQAVSNILYSQSSY